VGFTRGTGHKPHLVQLGQTLGSSWGTSLDLTGAEADNDIGDGNILGLTGSASRLVLTVDERDQRGSAYRWETMTPQPAAKESFAAWI
jgi:hypothetical protein